jgi:hypothetical protein
LEGVGRYAGNLKNIAYFKKLYVYMDDIARMDQPKAKESLKRDLFVADQI